MRLRSRSAGLSRSIEADVSSLPLPLPLDLPSPARAETETDTETDRSGAVTHLQEQVHELHAALDEAAEAIYRTDAAGQVISSNRSFAAMFGYQAGEFVGRSWEETVAFSDRGLIRADLMAIERVRVERTAVGVRKDGSSFPIQVTTVPLSSSPSSSSSSSSSPSRARGDEPRGHYFYVRDLTERRRMEEQLIFAGRMAAVGTLAAGVAHEINNPLAYIVANIDFTRRQLGTLAGQLSLHGHGHGAPTSDEGLNLDEVHEALGEARQGADRVRNIVRDLKVFGRGNEEAHGPVALRRVIDSSINIAWNEIRHRARLVKDYGAAPMVDGNESRLGQIFLNLLLNAAQAIGEGAADSNEIRITTGTDSVGRAVIEVRDTGLGIPPEIVARIFDPFFSTKPEGVGTGLGLWICRGILAGLGGEISVESRLGHGSTFRVTLPAAAAERVGGRRADRQAPEPENRGARVLIVDDEPMILGALRRALGTDYQITCASDGREALALLAAGERFDVVLCDLMMPQMTGMDLHVEVSRVAPAQVDRMIFVTGGAFTPRARAFLDRVPNARIEKPIDFQNMRMLMRNLLR